MRDLTYVYNGEGPRPSDNLVSVMKGFDTGSRSIQLACMDRNHIQRTYWPDSPPPVIHHLEPEVPFEPEPWRAFHAAEPFDVICVARLAAFTPAESDALFDEIRAQFVDDTVFA